MNRIGRSLTWMLAFLALGVAKLIREAGIKLD
jgi:hypothetical protein